MAATINSSAEASPDVLASVDDEKRGHPDATGMELPPATVARITRISSIMTVLVSGIALFSDGYNAQIIGYMEPLLSDL